MKENKLQFEFDPNICKVTVRNVDHLPLEIFDLAEKVEILDLSYSNIATLPEDFNKLFNLKVVFCSFNKKMTVFPKILGKCKKIETIGFRSCTIKTIPENSLPASLRALILTDNQISKLPKSIGNCSKLEKLTITGNCIGELPKELLKCQNIHLLRFAVNKLVESPDWLLTLPKLAWYADSSNPFSENYNHIDTPGIEWANIKIGEKLGSSVNNVVYQGKLVDGRDVAVKIYGDNLISDGLPEDDMKASLVAGEHPKVMGSIGKILNSPEKRQALVMPLIPNNFKRLGLPPTLESVCRDNYEEITFEAPFIFNILKDCASAMKHIHSQGVMHGDFYAHNILTNEKGESIVNDFGAASLYQLGSETGFLRERIDVRAFGLLIEELYKRSTGEEGKKVYLENIMKKCLSNDVRSRPSFTEVLNLLEKI